MITEGALDNATVIVLPQRICPIPPCNDPWCGESTVRQN